MTKPKKTAKADTPRAITLEAYKDEPANVTMARGMVGPNLRHGILSKDIATKMAGKLPGDPQFDEFGAAIKQMAEAAQKGDKTMATAVLTAQALTLDMMFTELARRATMNFGDYPLAAERYARLAFKAQSNSRAAFETLAKLHQPREQTVRHVHVNEGGQAIVADHFHQHSGGKKNEKAKEQPHATGTAGHGPALPSPDPIGNGVPITSYKGQETVQDARGE